MAVAATGPVPGPKVQTRSTRGYGTQPTPSHRFHMLHGVRALLCDLDDTLFDRTSAFSTWAAKYAEASGADAGFVAWMIAEDARGYRPRLELWEAIRRRLDLDEPAEELVRHYQRSCGSMATCAPEVLDALGRARAAGWKIGIVTNGDAFQHVKITAAGLEAHVDAICVSETEGCRKPDPRLLRLAASRCGVSMEGAWMVGDSAEADIGAANAAGIDSIWLSLGRAWHLTDYRPSAVATNFSEAVDLILGTTSQAEETVAHFGDHRRTH